VPVAQPIHIMMKQLSDSRKLTAHASSKWLVAAVGLAAAASLAPLTASAGVVTFENKSAEFRAGVDYTEAGMGYAFFWNFILSPDAGNPPSALVGFPVAISPFPNAPAGPAIFSTDTTSGRSFTLDGYDIGALGPDRQGGSLQIRGLLRNQEQFSFADTATGGFATRQPGLGAFIDRLELRVTPGSTTAVAIDNLRFSRKPDTNDIPEPGSIAILSIGLAALALVRSRRPGPAS
jgi:hypothetical protein